MILAKKVLGRSKKLLGHGYEAKHGKILRRGKR